MGVKAFLDTSVYVSFYRKGHHQELLYRINNEHQLFLHAVVLAELHAGAKTSAFLKELKRLEKLFVSKGRLIIPQKRDFVTAGRILRTLGEREKLADALLAASARHEGLVLVAEDTDFQRMKSVEPFSLISAKP